jgi:hypothetical protein
MLRWTNRHVPAKHKANRRSTLSTWRVSLIRARGGHRLGMIQAATRETAEAIAMRVFKLTNEQRGNLLIVKLDATAMRASRRTS